MTDEQWQEKHSECPGHEHMHKKRCAFGSTLHICNRKNCPFEYWRLKVRAELEAEKVEYYYG